MFEKLSIPRDIKEAIASCKSDSERLDVAERISYIHWGYVMDLEEQCTDERIKEQIHHIAVRGYRIEELSDEY